MELVVSCKYTGPQMTELIWSRGQISRNRLNFGAIRRHVEFEIFG